QGGRPSPHAENHAIKRLRAGTVRRCVGAPGPSQRECNHVNTARRLNRVALAAAVLGASLGVAGAGEPGNPFAPAYGHAYRHGAVRTREAKQRMDEWDRQHPAKAAKRSRNTLAYGGGIDGIGVTSSTPRVYLVFYGSQWSGSGDPRGAATYLQNLFHGIGTG